MLGYEGMHHFSGAGYQLSRKILKQGNVLLGRRQNFFIECMKESQNQL